MVKRNTITSVAREMNELRALVAQLVTRLDNQPQQAQQQEPVADLDPPQQQQAANPVNQQPPAVDPQPQQAPPAPVPEMANIPAEAVPMAQGQVFSIVAPAFHFPIIAPIVEEPVYERFRKQKPPMFNGTADPALAENWVRRI